MGSLRPPSQAPAGQTLRTLGARLAVLLVGLLAFAAMLWLTAEAPPDVTRAGVISVGPAPSLPAPRIVMVERKNKADRLADAEDERALSSAHAAEATLVDEDETTEGTTATANANESVMRRATRRRAEDFALYENPYLRDAVEEASTASGQLAPIEQPSLAAPEEPQVPAAP